MITPGRCLRVTLCTVAAAAAASAAAQPAAKKEDASFPTRPIRIVVPFPPGGTTDVVARIVAQRMSESTGQPVIVDRLASSAGPFGLRQ